jgi:RHS repeat-associated protein
MITNTAGKQHEWIEYTPYGETWIEHRYDEDALSLPYRFTGKELDEETGLYYYGARYLDPKTSRWISADPAMGEYIPAAPVNDEARGQNRNLPGMGGIFNLVNLHVYHYAGNNPVKYVDPDGRESENVFNRVVQKLKFPNNFR